MPPSGRAVGRRRGGCRRGGCRRSSIGPAESTTMFSIDVLQLPHVARPGVAHQHLLRLGLDAFDRLAVLLGRLLEEVVDQQRDVLAALAQRRDVDRHALDAEVQVLAELLVGDHLVEVAVGRADQAHVDVDRLVATRGARPRRSPARAAAWPACSWGMSPISSRNSVPPSACSKRPSRSVRASVNAPLTWPNSSSSRIARREAGAVQRDEPLLAPPAVVVDRAGDQLLAGAAFAHDQHGDVAGGDLPGGLHDAAASPALLPMIPSNPADVDRPAPGGPGSAAAAPPSRRRGSPGRGSTPGRAASR